MSQGAADVSNDWTQRNPRRRFHFDIDIVGACNLSCPSCPTGNSAEVAVPRGQMSVDLLERILRKATSECDVRSVQLYNWTEPMLHAKLPEMIRIVRSHRVSCGLSANLNIMRNIEQVMEANPENLRITVSGFTQDTYAWTHRQGDIEAVKRNMVDVAKALKSTRATTRVTVGFLRYLGNHEDEGRMKRYAESLGFEFEPLWAYFMPLEKVLAFAELGSSSMLLSQDDQALIARLALPLDRAIEAARTHAAAPCKLRDSQMALTFQGDVMLCCTVYDPSRYKLANFLSTPLDELQAMKFRHALCGRCMSHGLHVLATYGAEEFDTLALDHVRTQYPHAQLIGMREAARKREPHGIAGWPRKIKRKFQKMLARMT